jgi:hypothetical protein
MSILFFGPVPHESGHPKGRRGYRMCTGRGEAATREKKELLKKSSGLLLYAIYKESPSYCSYSASWPRLGLGDD